MRTLLSMVCLLAWGCDGGGTDPDPMMTGRDSGPMDPPGVDSGPVDPPDFDSGPPDPTDPPEPSDFDAPITFAASCPAFEPCGGDVGGRWEYRSVCVAEDFAELTEACPGATVEASGTARGAVEFALGFVGRDVTTHVETTIHVPAECAIAGCDTIETAIGMGATCAPAAGGTCDCTIIDDSRFADTDGYTIAGNQIVLENGTRYDYCVEGGTLRYRELGDSPSEPGTASLGR